MLDAPTASESSSANFVRDALPPVSYAFCSASVIVCNNRSSERFGFHDVGIKRRSGGNENLERGLPQQLLSL